MLLTQSTIPIIGWIATLMGFIMKYIYQALDSFGIQNIGLCIIIFTIIIRILMLPLMIRQQKFTKINQVMQPEIQKIQKKYRGKKDQASMMKQNEEIQAVYDKYGTNMTGGCAQLLIQFPVLLALYQVIRKPPAYIPQVKAVYLEVVNTLSTQSGYIKTINKIAKSLKLSYVKALSPDATPNQIIDVLTYFKPETWTKLASSFPSVSSTINALAAQINDMNTFALGINITQVPGFHPSIYWLIPLLAGVFQFLSFKTMRQPEMEGSAAGMSKSMSFTMPLMSVYFCLIMPAGLGIYWVVSAMFQCIQQVAINKYLDKADLDELIRKNREKAAKKKKKGKKSLMDRLMNPGAGSMSGGADRSSASSNSPRGINEIANMNLKKVSAPANTPKVDTENMSSADIDSLGVISKKAYIISKYEKEHNPRGGKK
jgi:YidC/Oxa1 family membrane protein insertase